MCKLLTEKINEGVKVSNSKNDQNEGCHNNCNEMVIILTNNSGYKF